MSASPANLPPLAKRARLTFDEVRERWQWSENDLREAVISGQLVPSIYEKGAIWPIRFDHAGKPSRMTPAVFSNHWLYAVSVNPTGPFDCNFDYLADTHDALASGGGVYQRDAKGGGFINNRVTLADVIANGVFATAELTRYEAAHGAGSKMDDDGMPGKTILWWQQRHDIVSMASRIEAQYVKDGRGLNQSGARAGKFSLTALGEAVSTEIGKAEKVEKSPRTISGKTIVNFLKTKGWE